MANHRIFNAAADDITASDTWYAVRVDALPDGIANLQLTLDELLHKSERHDVILPITDLLAPLGLSAKSSAADILSHQRLLQELLKLIERRTSRIGIWCDTSVTPEQLDAVLAGMSDKDQPLLNRLDLIVLYTPLFADGRNFSQAKHLRLQGYVGEIRVAGEFGRDQIAYLKRTGVDSFVIAEHEVNGVKQDLTAAFNALPSAYTGDNAHQLPMFLRA